ASAVALGRLLPVLGGGLGLLGIAVWVPRGATSDALLALLVLLPIALVDAFAPLPDAGALAVRTSAAQARLEALAQQAPVVTETGDPAIVELTHPASAARSISVGWGTEDALVDFDLDLPPGARVGLVGASGTGKSTFAAVMMRFLDPRAGSQTLADTDLRRLSFDDVRRTTGLVDDDPHIFASNVAENVRLARPQATDDEVRAALDAAHLGTWVDALPRGVATMIGEGSAHVSGGERARIAVARALLADQPVLVLDEPTAHLDAATARRVSDEVLSEERGRSIVWITHGTIGLDAMDTVIRLEG
ncbi:MAG: ATP-binding cassette domain-containing protein, partial [Nocardioidaceae bacterium]|nr:ATP-binding cassette domain-containing protein [Nocardioidaceae bacterium]